MKHRQALLIALLLIIGFISIQAQEAITAAGGESEGSGGLVSYTIGQVFYSINTEESGSMAEGVQQPFEIAIETGIDEPGINMNISAYPNPTTHILNLEIDASASVNFQTMQYQLIDMNGRLIATEQIVADVTTIVTSNLSPATYLVKVLGDNEEIKSFKVIKY